MRPDMGEAAVWILGVVFAGGLGWWANYVTQGATMARKLSLEFKHLAERMTRQEAETTEGFRAVQSELSLVRDSLGEMREEVHELHGKLDGISAFIKDGGRGQG